MATIHNFHSFIKLVRLMYTEQQNYFKQGSGDKNLLHKCMKLEAKVDKQLHEFHPQSQSFYEWQGKFIALLRLLRTEQKLYFQTRANGAYQRSRSLETNLSNWIEYLEKQYPKIFVHVEEAKQTNLFS